MVAGGWVKCSNCGCDCVSTESIMNELGAPILDRVCFGSSIGAEVVVVDTVMMLERSENGICDWVGVIEVDTVLTETAAITVVKKTDAVLI